MAYRLTNSPPLPPPTVSIPDTSDQTPLCDEFFDLLQAAWKPHSSCSPLPKALILGCGKSFFNEKLVLETTPGKAAICSHVTMVDSDLSRIQEMKCNHANHNNKLAFITTDITDACSLDCTLRKETDASKSPTFDLILDDSTFNAIAREQDLARLLAVASKYIACGGMLFMVSMHKPNLLRRLLTGLDLERRYEFSCTWVHPENGGKEYSAVSIHFPSHQTEGAPPCACEGPPVDPAIITIHLKRELELYKKLQQPLLTAQRKATIKSCFQAQNQDLLGTEQAYNSLYSPEERTFYVYSEFLQHLEDSGETKENPGKISLFQALAFIENNF